MRCIRRGDGYRLKILRKTSQHIHLQSLIGELAQLARALAWHARGHRFESGILHQKEATVVASFYIHILLLNLNTSPVLLSPIP